MQHHLAARQVLRDHPRQFLGRRNGAADADAGGDHRIGRRVLLPGAGLRPERLDPAHADIEQPRLGQPALPGRHDAAQEGQGDLPVRRMGFRYQRRQPAEPVFGQLVGRGSGQQFEILFLQRDLVQQGRQRAGQGPGLFRRGGAAAVARQTLDEAGQHRLAAQRIDRRRQVQQRRQRQLIRILGGEPGQRPHPGQQQGLLPGGAQEGGAQRPGGTPRRQQDGDPGRRSGASPGIASAPLPRGSGGRANARGCGTASWQAPQRGPPQNGARTSPAFMDCSARSRSAGSRGGTRCRVMRPGRTAGRPRWRGRTAGSG